MVQAEIFHLFVIEAPKSVEAEFPASKAGLNVLFVPDEKPYHERKVTLLNGPHTVMAPVGYLSGLNVVKECLRDDVMSKFVYMVMYKELIETLDLPKAELKKFADAVVERFNNPFVHHLLTSIMLNSFPKFKTRDLPGLKTYLERKGTLPSGLVLGLAAIITYYKGGKRGDVEIVPNDDKQIMDLLKILWSLNDVETVGKGVLAAEFIWGENLNNIPGLTEKLVFYLKLIQEFGMKEAIRSIVSKRFNLTVKADFDLPKSDEYDSFQQLINN